MPVQMSEFYYPSSDGKSQIHAMLWQQAVTAEMKEEAEASASHARGLIQLVHGVNEYIGRYNPLARFLAEQGFIVFGEDHLGHGKSGIFAQTPQGADDFIPRDSIQLALLMKARFAPAQGEQALPFILFGHSLGSAIARIMAAENALELAGLILCGTVHVPAFGQLLLPHEKKHSGGTKIVGNSIPLSWLSFDRENQKAYAADPSVSHRVSNGLNATTRSIVMQACRKGWADAIDVNLPVFVISGKHDPFGLFGYAPKRCHRDLAKHGCLQLKLKIYDEGRHEIFHENKIKAEVYQDILSFCEACL